MKLASSFSGSFARVVRLLVAYTITGSAGNKNVGYPTVDACPPLRFSRNVFLAVRANLSYTRRAGKSRNLTRTETKHARLV